MTTIAPDVSAPVAIASRQGGAVRLRRLERGYAGIRLLSIDVALAALGGGVMAARITGGHPRRAFYLLLPLAVWVVYTLDHLLDAARVGPLASTPRHQFHHRHARVLTPLALAMAVLCGVVGLRTLSPPSLLCGTAVAMLFAIHEGIVKLAGSRVSPLLIKELGVAAIFTAGTWGVPISIALHGGQVGAGTALLATQYLLLALANLLIFSLFEHDADARAGQSSFVQGIGRRRARRVAVGAVLAAAVVGAGAVALHPARAVLAAEAIYLAMGAGLWLILRFPRRFARYERYRSLGDGVFLLPLLMAAVR